MSPWTGIILAPSAPGDDRMGSRVPSYLHPLAGRSLAWHALSALAAAEPAPGRILLVADHPVNAEPFLDVWPELRVLSTAEGEDPWDVVEAAGGGERFLLVDARAPLLGSALGGLPESSGSAVLTDGVGRPAAARVDREGARRALTGWAGLAALLEPGLPVERVADPVSGTVVRSRRSLADAGGLLRDRLVDRLMEGGVTFLVPESVWVDLDVRVGRDAVVYPGVVLEGQTTVGDETVIGPGCRIVDSWIGSGVELKGWNYISHTSVRNRAILEPYVRRGFD